MFKPIDPLSVFLSHHLLGLRYRNTQEDIKIASGFVIEYCKQWYWMTAGHCVQHIKNTNIDSFVFNFHHKNPVIYDYKYQHSFFWLDHEYDNPEYDNPQYDIGLIGLNADLVKTMQKNDMMPLIIDQFSQPKIEEMFGFKLLGFPGNLQKDGIGISLVPIKLVDVSRHNVFIGKPHIHFAEPFCGETQVKIDGMSGGPLFGFTQRDEQNFAHIIGVQSELGEDGHVRIPLLYPRIQNVIHALEQYQIIAFSVKIFYKLQTCIICNGNNYPIFHGNVTQSLQVSRQNKVLTVDAINVCPGDRILWVQE